MVSLLAALSEGSCRGCCAGWHGIDFEQAMGSQGFEGCDIPCEPGWQLQAADGQVGPAEDSHSGRC